MIKEKYKQLFLYRQFGEIRTITIHRHCGAFGKTEANYTKTNILANFVLN